MNDPMQNDTQGENQPQGIAPPFSNQQKPGRFSLKLEKKVYQSQGEKKKDFWIGVGVFIGLNLLLSLLGGAITWLASAIAQSDPTNFFANAAFYLNCLLYPITLLANIAAAIYFVLTRTWIGVGFLSTFGGLLILGTVLGIVVAVICFATYP